MKLISHGNKLKSRWDQYQSCSKWWQYHLLPHLHISQYFDILSNFFPLSGGRFHRISLFPEWRERHAYLIGFSFSTFFFGETVQFSSILTFQEMIFIEYQGTRRGKILLIRCIALIPPIGCPTHLSFAELIFSLFFYIPEWGFAFPLAEGWVHQVCFDLC